LSFLSFLSYKRILILESIKKLLQKSHKLEGQGVMVRDCDGVRDRVRDRAIFFYMIKRIKKTSFVNNYFILSRISIFLYNKKDKKDKFGNNYFILSRISIPIYYTKYKIFFL
jgi:hypothetical protein